MPQHSATGLPMSTAQSDMWFAQQMDPGNWTYCVAQYIEIRGPVDIPTLRAAVRRTVADIESLRVRAGGDAADPRLVIEPLADWDFPVLDVSSADDPRAEAEARMRDELRRPVELTHAPLFRTILFAAGPGLYFWYHRCHHLALDGYGAALFAARSAENYTALAAGSAHPANTFAPLTDAVAAETAYLESSQYSKDRDFWRQRCAGLPGIASLAERPPADPGDGIVRSTGSLGPDLAGRLRTVARTARTTWSAAVIAGAAGFLHRMTGEQDLVLGLAVTGRATPALRRLPCTQSDVLPLRLRVRPGLGFGDLIEQTSREVREVLRHQRYRSAWLRRELEEAGVTGRWAGLEVNVMPFELDLAFGEHPAVVHNLLNGPVEDLAFAVYGATAARSMRVDADAVENRYSAEALHGHRARFVRFLAEAAADPQRPLGRTGLTSPEERRRVLSGWNDTARDNGVQCVVEQVRRQAAATPGAVAVTDGRTTLTYAALAGRASALSRRLTGAGAVRGSLVAILADRGADAVTGVLGVLGSGAAFLPLDPAVPRRAAAALAGSRATLLLTDRAHLTQAGELAVELAASGAEPPAVVACDDTADPPHDLAPAMGNPEDLGYVLFTSGSTGRPKGAMVHRRGMVNHLLAKAEDLNLTEADSVVQNAPLTFDISIWQMLTPLLTGGRVRVVDDECAADPERLFGLAADERITILEVVPSLLRAALDTWEAGPSAVPRPDGLRRLVVTGEDLPPELCSRWFALFPHIPLVNAYGPTECSDDVTHAIITVPPPEGEPTVSIGHPVRNTRLYVLDAGLQPVPPGTAGELYVGGTGVGRGYVHDPVRTAVAFVPDPFAGLPGARLYRTGDRARHRPDGSLEFLGRTDHQVKVRGQRIELGEVESALRALPGVRAATVSVVDGPGGTPALVGYVTGPADPAGLRAALAAELPEAMVPAVLTALDTLPLTPNGKIDRKALPAPDFGATAGGRPARNPRERLLCGLFQQVLGIPSVGIDDSFFDLGGNSISSVQLVNRARREGLVLTPRDVFRHRTVAELAAVARTGSTGVQEHPDAGIGPVPLPPVVHALREAGGPVDGFHQAVRLEVPATLTEVSLTAALQTVLDHHDALRLKLEREPEWQLRVQARGAVRAGRCLEVVRSEHPEDDAAARAAAARRRLSPGEGIMLQAVWLDAGRTRPGRLLLVVHHLAIDGLSWQILLSDLAAAWRAESGPGGRTAPGPEPVGTSYRTWAGLLHQAAHDPVRTAELPLWQEILRPTEPPLGTAPLDPERHTAGTLRTLTVELTPEQTVPLLDSVPSAFRAVTEDILLTALGIALTDRRRARDARPPRTRPSGVLVEVEGHGREAVGGETDLSRTVGWLTSQYPARIDPGTTDWDELWAAGHAAGQAIKNVKEQLRSLPDNGVGYGLLRHLNPETAETLSTFPPPTISFNHLGRIAEPPALTAAGWSLAGTGELVEGLDPDAPVRHVLSINVLTRDTPGGPRLTAVWSWPSELLPEADVRRIAGTWERALDVLTAHAALPDAGGRTASDFGLAGLRQDEIDEFEAEFAAEWENQA
ncbi:amino acid adenylation domain-containing protein [Streptomyces klenkii]|uniref:amino acid adenylation domain-containing protein n=1 Tax=Streptomyces klenkii TaxID=1420899 RepID=UPI0036E9F210